MTYFNEFPYIYNISLIIRNLPKSQSTQSCVLCTLGPMHGCPPFKGRGAVQVLTRLLPRPLRCSLCPEQKQSLHVDHAVQPPLTDSKEE